MDMAKRYAVVAPDTGVVENTVDWDGTVYDPKQPALGGWTPPKGKLLVEVGPDDPAEPGGSMSLSTLKFTPNPVRLPPPVDKVENTEELIQLLLDKGIIKATELIKPPKAGTK